MKKVLMLIFLILIMSGCDNNKNKYENFEHYDLKSFRIINSNTFYSDKGSKTYVVADMSSEKAEGRDNGIFYEIDQNDYILLDTINVSDQYEDLQYDDDHTYFYDNSAGKKQLFIIRNLGSILLKYNLNGENSEKTVLNFDMAEISSEPLEYVQLSAIKKVEKDDIYYRGNIHNKGEYNLLIKCSLSTYKCQLDH